jgi:hypothetical protein
LVSRKSIEVAIEKIEGLKVELTFVTDRKRMEGADNRP